MTAGLAQSELTQSQQVMNPPTALPSTFGERVSAGFDAAFTEDRYGNQMRANIAHTGEVIKQVEALGGPKLLNPHDLQPTMEEIRENLGQPIPVIMAKRKEKLDKTTAELRETYRDFMGSTPDGFLDPDANSRLIRESSN